MLGLPFFLCFGGCKLADTYEPSINSANSICPRLGIAVKFCGTLFEERSTVRVSSFGSVSPYGTYYASSKGEIATYKDPLCALIIEYAERCGFNCRADSIPQYTIDINKITLCHVTYDDAENSLNDTLIFWGSLTLLRRGSYVYPFRVKVYDATGELIGDRTFCHKGYVLSGAVIPFATAMSGENLNLYPSEESVYSWYYELIDCAKEIISKYEQ